MSRLSKKIRLAISDYTNSLNLKKCDNINTQKIKANFQKRHFAKFLPPLIIASPHRRCLVRQIKHPGKHPGANGFWEDISKKLKINWSTIESTSYKIQRKQTYLWVKQTGWQLMLGYTGIMLELALPRQCPISIPLKNVKRLKLFRRFQGV